MTQLRFFVFNFALEIWNNSTKVIELDSSYSTGPFFVNMSTTIKHFYLPFRPGWEGMPPSFICSPGITDFNVSGSWLMVDQVIPQLLPDRDYYFSIWEADNEVLFQNQFGLRLLVNQSSNEPKQFYFDPYPKDWGTSPLN